MALSKALIANKGLVITIAQQKGGAGKTTLAAHLAVALSQQQNKVAIVDVDPQGSLKHWYRLRENHLGVDYTGLHFVSFSGWKLNSELHDLKRAYDYIVIDSPPHIETDSKAAIKEANFVLIPIQPSPADAWATKATLDIAIDNNIPHYLILNRVPHNSKLAVNLRQLYPNILKSSLGNRIAFASCFNEGKCVTEIQSKSQASNDIKCLIDEIQSLIFKIRND